MAPIIPTDYSQLPNADVADADHEPSAFTPAPQARLSAPRRVLSFSIVALFVTAILTLGLIDQFGSGSIALDDSDFSASGHGSLY